MLWKYVLCLASLVPLATQARGEIRILGTTGNLTPGGLATIYCTGLTGIEGIVEGKGAPLPRTLAGVTVEVVSWNGSAQTLLPAPILAVADLGTYQQINFQVPWEVNASTGTIVIQGLSRQSAPPASSWDPFLLDTHGAVIAQHAADGARVTPDHPPLPGEWITAYGTGIGPVTNQPATGMPAAAEPLARLGGDGSTYTLRLHTGNSEAAVETNFIGLAPGMVGVFQMNFRVPENYTAASTLFIEKGRFCGFFFVQGCGRGWVLQRSTPAPLTAAN